MKLMRNICALLVCSMAQWCGWAHAAPQWGAVKKATVILKAEGLSPTQGNIGLEVWGTGFFINRDGGIATSYHLIDQLLSKGVKEESIQVFVYRDPTANPVRASKQGFDAFHDVLFLDIGTDGESTPFLPVLKQGRDKIVALETGLYVGGYPRGFGWRSEQGTLKFFDGPLGDLNYLWETNMKFREGLSGAPVMLNDGKVVGLVKGEIANADLGYVVPSSFFLPNYLTFAEEAEKPAKPNADRLTITANVDRIIEQVNLRTKKRKISLSPCHGGMATMQLFSTAGAQIIPSSLSYSISGGDEQVYVSSIDFKKPGHVSITLRHNTSRPCDPSGASVATEVDIEVSFRESRKVNETVSREVFNGQVTPQQELEIPASVAGEPITVTRQPASANAPLQTKEAVSVDALVKSLGTISSIGKINLPLGKINF